jgi:hypothetical protein
VVATIRRNRIKRKLCQGPATLFLEVRRTNALLLWKEVSTVAREGQSGQGAPVELGVVSHNVKAGRFHDTHCILRRPGIIGVIQDARSDTLRAVSPTMRHNGTDLLQVPRGKAGNDGQVHIRRLA